MSLTKLTSNVKKKLVELHIWKKITVKNVSRLEDRFTPMKKIITKKLFQRAPINVIMDNVIDELL
jgi:hypothetical protein